MRSGRFAGLTVLFFCSGACGLIYQVLWLRQLSLVFGVTVYAASTVLSAFMGGLALGSSLARRLLTRMERPLAAFGAAEIGVGLTALATPLGLGAAEGVYAAIHRAFPDAIGFITVARLICSMLVLLVPTILMGLTLPLLSGSSLVREFHAGSRVSTLYAVNTAGAMTGVIAAGFYLIGNIGMRKTLLVAASGNVLVGLLALLLASAEARTSGSEVARAPAKRQDEPVLVYRVVAFAIFLSGAAALGLEIVWFRLLAQFVEATSYAFTTMLATVLAGIAAGGLVSSWMLTRERDSLRTVAIALAATGLAAVASVIWLSASYRPGWSSSGLLQASAAAIFPAALFMGIAFPSALRVGAALDSGNPSSSTEVAGRVGRLYALNVAGAILGALAVGFVVLPSFGARRALILLSSLFVMAALAVIVGHPARRRLAVLAILTVALFAWISRRVPDPLSAAMSRRYAGLQEIFREEGAQITATVRADSFHRVLFLNGLHQADDTYEMVKYHAVIGHLPMLLHPAPRNILVVGLGGGVTPGAMSRYPEANVHIVELSASVPRGAAFFSHVNADLLSRRNVRLRVDDGRNFLKFTSERFDVITADAIQPVFAGAGNLYAREYFILVRKALRDHGLALQWIGLRESEHYKAIMRTFLDVFPQASLWYDGQLLVGGLGPLTVDLGRVERLLADPALHDALESVGLRNADTLRSWLTAGPEEMRRFVGAGPLLTDDRPLLEYYRSVEGTHAPVDVTSLRGDARSAVRWQLFSR